MQDRLTERSVFGNTIMVRGEALGPAYFEKEQDYENYRDALQRLAAYEDTGLEPSEVQFVLEEYKRYADADEQGRLIVLPCKVGDTVYKVWYDPCHNGETHPDSYGCTGCEDVCDIKKSIHEMKAPSIDWILRQLHNGSFVYFLTREETEAALERGKSDGD